MAWTKSVIRHQRRTDRGTNVVECAGTRLEQQIRELYVLQSNLMT
jgi:hypothetical protein